MKLHQYQAKQEFLREQRSIQMELEQASKALIQSQQGELEAQRREEVALAEKQEALAEIERLKALLNQKNH